MGTITWPTPFDKGAHLALIQKDLPSHLPEIDLRSGKLPQDFIQPEPPFCLRVENTLKALQTIARFCRRKLNLRVIGVTGSVGKSTTKELIAEVLCQRYRTLKNQGNLNNEIGLPLTLLRLGAGHERAVLEMGFYIPGEISFLCRPGPAPGGRDHQRRHRARRTGRFAGSHRPGQSRAGAGPAPCPRRGGRTELR